MANIRQTNDKKLHQMKVETMSSEWRNYAKMNGETTNNNQRKLQGECILKTTELKCMTTKERWIYTKWMTQLHQMNGESSPESLNCAV